MTPIKRSSLFRCVALLAVLLTALPVADAKFCFKCLFHCPKDDSYDPACLRSALPPWPICWFHSVDDFVDHARDSATRCCGDDTSDCRCPKRKSAKFQDHIVAWCVGVASCGAGTEAAAAALGDGNEEAEVKVE